MDDIFDTVFERLKIKIHNNMRTRQLWKNDGTGVIEHDVPYEEVGYEPRKDDPSQKYGVPFMQDNYTIMALVGLISRSEYVVRTRTPGEEVSPS